MVCFCCYFVGFLFENCACSSEHGVGVGGGEPLLEPALLHRHHPALRRYRRQCRRRRAALCHPTPPPLQEQADGAGATTGWRRGVQRLPGQCAHTPNEVISDDTSHPSSSEKCSEFGKEFLLKSRNIFLSRGQRVSWKIALATHILVHTHT